MGELKILLKGFNIRLDQAEKRMNLSSSSQKSKKKK
jgi:hypothetical protein